MSFLDDKKNQPIIIGVAVAVILAVGVFMYLQMRPASPESDASAVADQATIPQPGQTPAPGDPAMQQPGAPPVDPAMQQPGMGAPAPGATAGTAETASTTAGAARPIEKFRVDPFAMLNPPKAIKRQAVVVREQIPYPTWLIIPKVVRNKPEDLLIDKEVIDTTPRRMAGVMFGSTVSAILETGSETLVVKPGDIIENSAMRVEKIEPNRIVLKSLSGKTRYVDVKMAASLGNNAPAAAPTPPTGSPTVNPYAPMRPPAGPGARPGGRGS